MKEFSRFLTAKQVEQELDLDPDKRYTKLELLVLTAKVFRDHFIKEKLQQQQQLSDPSPMITGEESNQCFSGQNSVYNAFKKEDISIPRKARTKKAVLDLSRLDKKMAMTSQTVIDNKRSEYPEGMPREEVLRRERLLKRPMEFDDENVMPKRVKRDYYKFVRFEDPDYDGKEKFQEMKKTQKISSRKTPNNSKKEKEKNKGSFGMQKKEILNPPQELPEKIKSRIKEMGGKNEILVITKRLTTSDCNKKEGRLSMPFSNIKEFLFENEKIHLQEQQQLSDPSPIITGENGNQSFSGQDAKNHLAIENTCKKNWDISIPKKDRTKEAVLDISKLEKEMAMTSQRVITKSEYPERMSREEILRRERFLKRPQEIEEENVMQKKTQKRSSIFKAVRDFATFLEAKDFEKLIDLYPNKTYTDGDVLAVTAKAFKAHFEREKLQQQLFDPSLMITDEEGNAASLSDDDEETTLDSDMVVRHSERLLKARIIFGAMEEFAKFLKTKHFEKLIDLDPNKIYTDGDVLVATVEAYKAHFEREELQQQLSDPSLMIAGEEGIAASFSDDDGVATQLSGSKSVPRGKKLSLQGRGSSKLKQTSLDADMVVLHSGRSASASGRNIATEEENLDSASSDEAVEYGVYEVQECSNDDENLPVKWRKRTAPRGRGRASGSTAKKGRKSDNTSSSSIHKILTSKDDEEEDEDARVTRNYDTSRR